MPAHRYLSCLAFLLFGSLFPAWGDSPEVADLVDPLIGTEGVGRGSCMPGPCLPHASVYPSPDSEGAQPSGYDYKGKIVGFSQLHCQGTGGVPTFGNFLISPQIGLQIAEKEHASDKMDEIARAYSYSVVLSKNKIKCELVPSAHGVLYKFTFPASTDSHLVLDVARKIGSSKALDDGGVTIDPATGTISGGGIYSGNWTPGRYHLYFTAVISRKPDSFGTWSGAEQSPHQAHAEIKKTEGGAFVGFSTHQDEEIYLKIGVSFKSQEQSAQWLRQEIPDWDFEKVKVQAKDAWNSELSTVTVKGEDEKEIGRFYTGLFHTMVQPRDRTHDIWDSAEPFWDDHYTLWDTWRTVYPLLGLTDAKAYSGVVNSVIARHQRYGYVPEAVAGGVEYAAGQGGNEVDNVITEAWLDQIPDIDWKAAYALEIYNAEKMRTAHYRDKGYVSIEEPKQPYAGRFKSGAATLEFAYNDYCVAQLAKALGHQDDYRRYSERAQNWKNVWNSELKDGEFSGFPNSRHQDGTPSNTPARTGYNVDFYEGTCWIYSYRPTFAIPELIEKMGGKELFAKRLAYALKNNLIDFTNEPSFQTIWLWCALNRPYLASYWANRLKEKYQDRAMPGDEDNGAMSSLYCFLDLGIFPFAGQDLYYLHGGRLPETTFHLHNGKTFTIISKNASAEHIYIQSASLNGQPLNKPFIRNGDIYQGGTLEFVMGPRPSSWGCAGELSAKAAEADILKLSE